MSAGNGDGAEEDAGEGEEHSESCVSLVSSMLYLTLLTVSGKLLSEGLFDTLSCRNIITSKNLHFGKADAAAPERVMFLRLSMQRFKLSFKFLKVFCKNATEINKKDMSIVARKVSLSLNEIFSNSMIHD